MKGIKVLERVLAALPIMLGVCIVVFLFMRFIPGDPVDIMLGEASSVTPEEEAALRAQFNLDQPIHIQLLTYLGRVFKGDLGYSISRSADVKGLLLGALPATIELAAFAILIGLIVAIPLGIVSAVKHNSALDRAGMAGAFVGVSMPSFWLGIVLMLVFSVHLKWLPTSGRATYGFAPSRITGFYILDSLLGWDMKALGNCLRHLLLPAIALGAAPAAAIARVVRSSMIEAMGKDYVTFARAKGTSEIAVIIRHAFRNALIPAVTLTGLEIGSLLGGNMIIETIFGWPGMGRLVVNAIFDRDYSLVQGAVMLYGLTFVLANLATDILYTYLYPKMQTEEGV